MEVESGSLHMILDERYMVPLGIDPESPGVDRKEGRDETGQAYTRRYARAGVPEEARRHVRHRACDDDLRALSRAGAPPPRVLRHGGRFMPREPERGLANDGGLGMLARRNDYFLPCLSVAAQSPEVVATAPASARSTHLFTLGSLPVARMLRI